MNITSFVITLIIGLFIVAVAAFIVGINLKYYNTPKLKFKADKELDISQVTLQYKDIVNFSE